MRFSVKEAAEKFGELVELAKRGEQIIIEQENSPVAEIIPIPITKGKFKLGILDGVLTAEGMPDFLEPMDEEDLRLWEGGA